MHRNLSVKLFALGFRARATGSPHVESPERRALFIELGGGHRIVTGIEEPSRASQHRKCVTNNHPDRVEM